MKNPDKKGREQKKQETRTKLYETAIHLFKDKGYEDTSIAQITKHAGTAKGTFFNYFSSKADIIAEWYLSTLSLNMAPKSENLENTLSVIITGRLKILQTHPELLRAKILCESSSDAIIKAEQLVDERVCSLILEALVKDKATHSGFTVPVKDIAELTLVVLTGAARAWRYNNKNVELSEFVEAQIKTLLTLIQSSRR